MTRLRIQHRFLHARPRADEKVPEHIKAFINQHCQQLEPPAISLMIFDTFSDDLVKPSQVYHWWRKYTLSRFHRNNDEIISAGILIDELREKGFERILFSDAEEVGISSVAFVTPLFRILAQDERVEEYHIDSTFKTNRKGYELFGIVGNCCGAGYGVAYLLLRTTSDCEKGKYYVQFSTILGGRQQHCN